MAAMRGAVHGFWAASSSPSCSSSSSSSSSCRAAALLDLRDGTVRHSTSPVAGKLKLMGPTASAMVALRSAFLGSLRNTATQQMELPGTYLPFCERPSALDAAIAVVLGTGSGVPVEGISQALEAERRKGGLGICIATKPFVFEGQKRQRKAQETLNALLRAADLLVVVEHEAFLRIEDLTVMEASCLSNELVLLAVQALSELVSPRYGSDIILGASSYTPTEMSAPEILPLLRSSGKARIGFGRASTVAEAVREACSHVSDGRLVICALASTLRTLRNDELKAAMHVMRSSLPSDCKCICFSFQDSSLDSGLKQATVIVAGLQQPTITSNEAPSGAGGITVTASNARCSTEKQELDTFPLLACDQDDVGPCCAAAKAWAASRSRGGTSSGTASPVGVRDGGNVQSLPHDPAAVPRSNVLEAMCTAVSGIFKGKEETTQPSLTERAASMLESERSQKGLMPPVEMDFRDGLYRGRCEGGVPDGKGRLTYADGSFYEGNWRQGKKDGTGSFFYANGDMYQGTWQDDLKHGKGWLYFHTGDRLYADFVRGKADGEGRYYSADGSLLFGYFRENWRHGECICIDVAGTRWLELWNAGVLVSRKQLG